MPPTKEFGKHCPTVHIYDICSPVPHVPFLIETTECKIQNHLTSEARIFCYRAGDLRSAQFKTYGTLSSVHMVGRSGVKNHLTSVSLCDVILWHLSSRWEQLRDWARASVCQSVDGSRTLWGTCCECRRGWNKELSLCPNYSFFF
jgi:hypothetical protein